MPSGTGDTRGALDPNVSGGAAALCAECGNSISEEYYLASGAAWCPACRLVAASRSPALRWGNLLTAAVVGFLGMVLAAAVWAGVRMTTGYELGIIAIVVGLVVGQSVRLGARGASGRSYQFLAVMLTFGSLAYSFTPILIEQIRNHPNTLLSLVVWVATISLVVD